MRFPRPAISHAPEPPVINDSAPLWLRSVSRPGAVVFALMFTLESLTRAVLLTIIPLQAYEILGNARDVSLLYVGVGLTGVAGSFTIPLLIRRFRRRRVYVGGVCLLIATAGLLATGTLLGQVLAMLCRSIGAAALNITLSLYVMDYIRKRDLVRSEPLKLMFSAAAWGIGPLLGVALQQHFGRGAPELVSALSGVALLAYFAYLRLTENPAVAAATRQVANPFANIRRFVAQPRLRLAWVIPFARSVFWSMFFIYPPVYFIQKGLGPLAGGVLGSVGNGLLIFTPLFGGLAQRIGLRRPIIAALAGSGVLCLMATLGYDHPWLVATCLAAGAIGAVALDGLANIPFMRAVHPYERPQMTTVFRTYIDFSDLLSAGLYSVLLGYFDLRAVFCATGLGLIAVAFVARLLPRRM
jgi:MFS family permease